MVAALLQKPKPVHAECAAENCYRSGTPGAVGVKPARNYDASRKTKFL